MAVGAHGAGEMFTHFTVDRKQRAKQEEAGYHIPQGPYSCDVSSQRIQTMTLWETFQIRTIMPSFSPSRLTWKGYVVPTLFTFPSVPLFLSIPTSTLMVHPSLERCHRASWALCFLPDPISEEGINCGYQIRILHGGPSSPDSSQYGISRTRQLFSNMILTLFSIVLSFCYDHRFSLGFIIL